jgi:sugar phosphate isomerase/epimerase
MRLGFSAVTSAVLDVRSAFALASELALQFVELSADLHEVAPALQDPATVRELVRSTGVGVTVHLSYVDLNLASLIPAARRTSVDRTLRGLEFAHAVGASCGVLHSGLSYLRHARAEALVETALRDSLRELEGSSVPIAVENLCLTPDDFVRGPRQLHELTRRHALRNTLDFGHAHVEGTREGRDAIAEYLQVLGSDIVHLHVHDNDGRSDQHRPAGEGTIDYRRHAAFLRSFDGTVCLEIMSGEDGVRASVAHLRNLEEVSV